jgi:hypothetical protein
MPTSSPAKIWFSIACGTESGMCYDHWKVSSDGSPSPLSPGGHGGEGIREGEEDASYYQQGQISYA